MMRGLQGTRSEIIYCHEDIWHGVEDKSSISAWRNRVGFVFRWLLSYPRLIVRYLRLPKHDVVLVGYMGHLDVLILWPFARLRNVPVIWDAFLSLYNTIVEDRKLISARNPLAYLLYGWEWLACRAATLVILDTMEHGRYFLQRFRLQPHRIADVKVGVETDTFHAPSRKDEPADYDKDALSILFYGQFIPLHGIETIIRAAALLEEQPFRWWLVGRGAEEEKIRRLLAAHPLPRLSWVPWVPYAELPDWISRADICLGIFGATRKAGLVIPNKVFQALALGKPLITRDSLAIRELLDPGMPGVRLVAPADPVELADAVMQLREELDRLSSVPLHDEVLARIAPAAIGERFFELACQVTEPRKPSKHTIGR